MTYKTFLSRLKDLRLKDNDQIDRKDVISIISEKDKYGETYAINIINNMLTELFFDANKKTISEYNRGYYNCSVYIKYLLTGEKPHFIKKYREKLWKKEINGE